MTSLSLLTRVPLLLLIAITAAGTACKRGATTSCHEDIDCPPGFDCVGIGCVRRQRMRFGADPRPAPAETSAPREEQPDARPATGVDAAPGKAEVPAPPPHRAPALPVLPPPADQPRLPMWKERLKNS